RGQITHKALISISECMEDRTDLQKVSSSIITKSALTKLTLTLPTRLKTAIATTVLPGCSEQACKALIKFLAKATWNIWAPFSQCQKPKTPALLPPGR